jgi:hypothetical protein
MPKMPNFLKPPYRKRETKKTFENLGILGILGRNIVRNMKINKSIIYFLLISL